MTTPRRSSTSGPTLLVATAGFGLLALPLIALVTRAPLTSIGSVLGTTQVKEAIAVSITVSLAAAGISVALGTPMALVLARLPSRVRRLARAVVLLPMVLPPVVGGAALLFALGRTGALGQYLDDWFGLTLPFSTGGAIVAASFVALPFYVVTVDNALGQIDVELVEAAETMGASGAQMARLVLLPAVRPAIATGAALAWARAVGEFGATVTFAGNLPGRTQTLPLAIFSFLNSGATDEALAVSVVLLGISLLALVAMRGQLNTPQ